MKVKLHATFIHSYIHTYIHPILTNSKGAIVRHWFVRLLLLLLLPIIILFHAFFVSRETGNRWFARRGKINTASISRESHFR